MLGLGNFIPEKFGLSLQPFNGQQISQLAELPVAGYDGALMIKGQCRRETIAKRDGVFRLQASNLMHERPFNVDELYRELLDDQKRLLSLLSALRAVQRVVDFGPVHNAHDEVRLTVFRLL